MQYHYIYQIINNITNELYIGAHSTNNIQDGYMGSGNNIKNAIKQYGKENFTKTIIEFFDNRDDMFIREREIVNDEFIARSDTYNIAFGGIGGGIEYANVTGKNLYGLNGDPTHGGQNLIPGNIQVIIRKLNNTQEAHVKKMSIMIKQGYDDGTRTSSFKLNNPLYTEKGKIAHKKALAAINHQQGTKNSQYGTRWITNGDINMKISQEDVIPEGWLAGRKIKR